MTERERIKHQYELLKELYGFDTAAWDMIHTEFNSNVFCEENRKLIISEYLQLEFFVKQAKAVGFTYYYGIDDFLKEYKTAVYNCLNCK